MPEEHFRLFDLPFEVRVKIYYLVKESGGSLAGLRANCAAWKEVRAVASDCGWYLRRGRAALPTRPIYDWRARLEMLDAFMGRPGHVERNFGDAMASMRAIREGELVAV